MEKKLTKIVGLKKSEFDAFVESGDISLRKAHLISFFKPGDEMGLTSVILASLRLIKEFRKAVLSAAKMMSGGRIYVFTEVTLPQFPESRVDGLLIVVKSGVIRDAALFEMKNGKSDLEKDQIERYQQIAKAYLIPRLITVSNQFVSVPTQFPIAVKQIKSVDLYHFSWSYLLTLAHVLLFDNDTNIADEDQVEIMREVVDYLEFDKSGVCGFNQMKKGWSETVDKINTGALLKSADAAICEAVISWQQEERDIALILSRSLGTLVDSGQSKYRGDLKARLESDTKKLIADRMLVSTLRVRGAVSDIQISALFEKRTIEMSVSLKPPMNKKMRGQLSWMKRQLITCGKKDEATFDKIKGELIISIWMKNMRSPERINLAGFDDVYEHIKGREIKEFRIVCIKDFGKKFASRKIFVDTIEQMSLDFYRGVVQHLVKWEPTAPKMGPEGKASHDTVASVSEKKETIIEQPPVINEEPTPVEEISTAPCPLCAANLILSTLHIGMNKCPHCSGEFEAE